MGLLIVVDAQEENKGESKMAIRMRNSKDPNSVCCECGNGRRQVLDMFDICIGGNIFTICDECNEVLLHKTLTAECNKNNRVKSPEDMAIIRKRASGTYMGSYKAKWFLTKEEKRLKGEKE